jgi:Polyketide cyclase / dehydrase and lipid transport
MDFKIPPDINTPVRETASIIIDASQITVFTFVAENFFENYPKWAPEIIEVKPLENSGIAVGVQAKQVREEYNETIESTFVIEEYSPNFKFTLHGSEPEFKSTYLTENDSEEGKTKLTFSFELLSLDVFMRPFAKLIRSAIKEGAENTVGRIKELISNSQNCNNLN